MEQFLHLRDPECSDPSWRAMLERGCLAARMVAEMRDAHPEVAGIAAQTMSQLMADVTAVVLEGQAAGEFRRDLDAEVLATTVVSSWMAALVMPEVQRKGAALDALNRPGAPAAVAASRVAGAERRARSPGRAR